MPDPPLSNGASYVSADPTERRRRVGVLTHGSLGQGVEMKLDPARSVETVRAGTFVVVEGAELDFFSLITDLQIDAANEAILLHPPGREDELLRRVMQGSGTYATVSLRPMLMLDRRAELSEAAEPQKVKTVPAHFSVVGEATDDDVARVFKSEATDPKRYFEVGRPVGMDTPVCLDLDRFVERSNAVFGKTGTGKSFLTRLLLAGLIRTGKAVNLIFDTHGEYGFGRRNEEGVKVKGLKDLFGSRVQVFSLDPGSLRRRNVSADVEVHLYADQVLPADVLPLRGTLNLNQTASESAFLLYQQHGPRWLTWLLGASGDDVKQFADASGANVNSVEALKRKLAWLGRRDYFRETAPPDATNVLDALMNAIDRGVSVVLDFGRHGATRDYLLVANVLTRLIRDRYEEKVDRYEASDRPEDEPRQLLITVEEAHNFLAPGIAQETPFGKIAREMRKFYVSLLVVDQRPSGIDDEVLSQIGTKFVAQLNDEKDIAAALVGTSGAASLRQILASLDSKQQALLLGHAVPMPITLTTRTWGADLFKALKGGDDFEARSAEAQQAEMHDLF